MKTWLVIYLVLSLYCNLLQGEVTPNVTQSNRTDDRLKTTLTPTTSKPVPTSTTVSELTTTTQAEPTTTKRRKEPKPITSFDYGDYLYPYAYTEDNIPGRIARNPALNSSIDAILVILVLQTMLGLGCTMDIAAIREHFKNPTGILVASICQFGVMPLISFIMAEACGLNKIAAIAVLVTGSCPGGNLSNLLTYFSYGDVNLSVLMSTVSTIMSIVMMPLCLFIYGTTWISTAEIGRMIPFGGILLSLILTLLPVAVGIAIRRWSEKIANIVLKISLLTLAVSVIAIMTLSGMLFGAKVFTALPASMYAIAIFLPLIGYSFGYLLALGFGLPDASKRTVGIETGCQNSQLSSAILKMAFSSQLMEGYFLFPLYYAVFQALEGLGFIIAFRIYRRYHSDEELAPISRVTYDKFDDDEWDADDNEYKIGEYSRISGTTVEGRSEVSAGGGYQGSGFSKTNGNPVYVNKQPPIPSDLPITNAYSPSPQESAADERGILTPEDGDDNYNFASNGKLHFG